MMFLTLLVWVYMYVRRISFLLRDKVDLRKVDTPEKMTIVVPDNVALAAHNLKNLFELPVIFYAACLYLYATAIVDVAYLVAAWVFFGFRLLHSLIHCTSNIVIYRFLAYLASALALWFMVLRAAAELLATF